MANQKYIFSYTEQLDDNSSKNDLIADIKTKLSTHKAEGTEVEIDQTPIGVSVVMYASDNFKVAQIKKFLNNLFGLCKTGGRVKVEFDTQDL